jgi:PAS domain S-box-containing protein
MGSTRDSWADALRNPQQHTAQLYTSAAFLGEAVGLYIAEGARRGETGIVIATPEHSELIRGGLVKHGVEPDELVATGRLVMRDAEATLATLMNGGRLDRDRVADEVTRLLRAGEAQNTPTRTYGEMVMLLWGGGNAAAAIELEQLWNQMIVGQRCAVMCGYHADAIAGTYPAFDAVRREHVQVLPSEQFIDDAGIDRLTSLAQLEHQARELRSREQLIKSIFESSRDCITVLDSEARLVFMSEIGLASLELWDFEMVRGKSWFELWQGADRTAARRAFAMASAGMTSEFLGVFDTLLRKRQCWWHVVLSPILDTNGQVHQVLAVWHDVTDRKRLEAELRRAIEARDELLAVASHELQRPIAALKSHLDKVRATNDPRDHLSAMLAETSSQVERLERLVDGMLGVSSINAGTLTVSRAASDLSQIVLRAFDRYRDRFVAANAPVVLHLADDVQGAWDVDRIEQIVENLLVNALAYAPGAAVTLTTRRAGTNVQLIIADRGPGIPLDKRHMLFERFERIGSTRTTGTLGLGLFIVRQLVEAHEGRVGVETTEGGGATFVVELPAAASAEQQSGHDEP